MKGRPVGCLLLAAALVMLPGAAGTLAQRKRDAGSTGSQSAAVRNQTVYDGNWWLKTDELTQSGFLDGIADYVVAVNRAKWLKGSIAYGIPKVTEFYRRDRRNLVVLVPDAWRRVIAESPPPPPLSGGEVWDGPHGYYTGDWYQMGAYEERIGYLAAYFWCLRMYGKQTAAVYPRSLDYYDQKVWDYIGTRKAYYEPAADILARFRSAVPN